MAKYDNSDLHPSDPGYKRNILRDVALFCYNPQTHKVLGRTPLNWGKLGLCYLGTYCLLTGITVGMFSVFYFYMISPDVPRLIGVQSLLNGKPGISKRPALPDPIYSNSNQTYVDYVQPFIDDLDDYLAVHLATKGGKDGIDCTNTTVLKKGEACKVDMATMFPPGSTCTKALGYGYTVGKPCIAVKINRIYGWKPELYDMNDLPADFPKNRYVPNRLTLNCAGSYPTDKEHIGSIKYIPADGISIKYFPYLGQKNYLDPFIWVQFLNATRTLDLRIKCKFFAKNIGYHYRVDISFIEFELVIDE